MSNELSRRDMLSRAGLALGGAMTLGVLNACSSEDDPAPIAQECPPPDDCPVDTSPKPTQFPYEQFIPATFQFDLAALKPAAYNAYFGGAGCGHATFSALIDQLKAGVGAPITLLPSDFCKFAGGGVAGYGSICGAALGGTLIINMTVAAAARNNMITDLLRWYEGAVFPQFVPATANAGEDGKKLDFSAGNLVNIQTVAQSHLCHASLTTFAAANGVATNAADKHARCSRLAADVAAKVGEMLNTYLAGARGAYTAAGRDQTSAGCVSCHTPGALKVAATDPSPAATGMVCNTCHTTHALPTGHSTNTVCGTCHK